LVLASHSYTPPDLAREAADRQVIVLSDGKDGRKHVFSNLYLSNGQ
jgi:hypothetical protein